MYKIDILLNFDCLEQNFHCFLPTYWANLSSICASCKIMRRFQNSERLRPSENMLEFAEQFLSSIFYRNRCSSYLCELKLSS